MLDNFLYFIYIKPFNIYKNSETLILSHLKNKEIEEQKGYGVSILRSYNLSLSKIALSLDVLFPENVLLSAKIEGCICFKHLLMNDEQ